MKSSDFKEVIDTICPDVTAEELMLVGLQSLIAAEITIRRQKMGMTQAQFAQYMGCTQGMVSRWENGDGNFTLKNLVKIASKLDIPMQCPFKTSVSQAQFCNNGGKVIYWNATNAYHSAGRYVSQNSYHDVDNHINDAKEM